MNKTANKTQSYVVAEQDKQWWVFDAKQYVLGRLSTEVAQLLRGKHRPNYTQHLQNGDYVIIINAGEINVTGRKKKTKTYFHHTGYPGGIKSINFSDLIVKKPEEALYLAIKGMMPKGPLGRKQMLQLKIYAKNEHPHQAQNPKPWGGRISLLKKAPQQPSTDREEHDTNS